jgi:hypothetical protein
LPTLRWHCHQHRAGLFALIALASLPALQTSVCPIKTQSQHVRVRGVVVLVIVLAHGLIAVPASFHGDLAFDGPADAALVSLLALCWRPWPHCAGVITNIALLLLPALRWHHRPRCMGAFSLIALALLPLSPSRRRQHCKLASAQSRSSRDTRWRHRQHRAVIVAGVAPASSPSSRRCLCPRCAGIAALGTPASPPASRTGICPVMTQSRHVLGEASLSRSTSSLVALLLYPASAHRGLAFVGLAEAAMAFFGVALVSLPASHWHHRQHQAVLVAGVAPALLPSWPSKVRLVPRWRLPALRWRFARIVLASLPALCRRPCCRRFAGVIALVTWVLLPLSRWHRCPCRLCVAASIANWRLPSHEAVATRAGVIASIAPLLLPALRRHRCPRCAGVFALVTLASPPLAHPRCLQHHQLASGQS